MPSPTTATSAHGPSTSTCAIARRSATAASSPSGRSTDTVTETSLVAMRSSTTSWRRNASKTPAMKPDWPSMRAELMFTRRMPRLLAMLVTPAGASERVGRITVPAAFGSKVLRMRTGMPPSSAGWIVAGWITFAP